MCYYSAMKKIMFVVALVIGLVILIFGLLMFNPLVFLPHSRISIILPFPESVDSRTGLIPYGEKIEHNEANGNPDGHAGIDFGWNEKVEIIASHDGLISEVQNTSEGMNVTIRTLYYKTVYKELTDLSPKVKQFTTIKQGDLIGYPAIKERGSGETGPAGHGQVHWEFSSTSMAIDRLCPMGYFDVSSRARIEAIWAAVPENNQFKKLYPDICSGVFNGKEN